jgi:hypothetical protein
VILVVRLVLAGMMPEAPAGTADFSGLAEVDQGPIKF